MTGTIHQLRALRRFVKVSAVVLLLQGTPCCVSAQEPTTKGKRNSDEAALATGPVEFAKPPPEEEGGIKSNAPDKKQLPDAHIPPAAMHSFEKTNITTTRYKITLKPKDGLIDYEKGVSGQALFTKGEGAWVEGKLSPEPEFPGGLTLEFWFKRQQWQNPDKAGASKQTMLVLSGKVNEKLRHVAFNLRPKDGALSLSFVGEPGTPALSTKNKGTPADKWQHVALVFTKDPDTLRLYLNGKLIDETEASPQVLLHPLTKISFGAWHKKNQAFRGHIDELRLYDYPRDAKELRSTFKSFQKKALS